MTQIVLFSSTNMAVFSDLKKVYFNKSYRKNTINEFVSYSSRALFLPHLRFYSSHRDRRGLILKVILCTIKYNIAGFKQVLITYKKITGKRQIVAEKFNYICLVPYFNILKFKIIH